jgi:membrane protease subunit HflK
MLKQYQAAPEVTRKRLWLETMEQVMADNPKVIDGSDGRNIINLPAQQGGASSPANADSSAGVVVPAASSDSADKGAQP